MKKGLIQVWLLTLLLFFVSCASLRQSGIPSIVSTPSLYNPVSVKMHPAFIVYHGNTDSSQLVVKIFPTELLYSGGIEPNKMLGLVRMRYLLTDITDDKSPVLADSGTVTFRIPREEADKRFIATITLRAAEGKLYQLAVVSRDQVRREENSTYLYVDKRSKLSSQNFMLIDPATGLPFFQPYITDSTEFRLITNNTGYQNIYVSYYGNQLPLPRPAFSDAPAAEVAERADSIWELPLNDSFIYRLNYNGIYHFRLDTASDDGLTLFNFGESYPEVNQAPDLIEPLAYLTTSIEYKQLQSALNPKLALDDFWLEKAGNTERARELIRVFYNRVYYSNYYFTSLKPGWKTDRGMIFIIFGPPQSVTSIPGQEKWVYYKNNFETTVTFTFNHVPSRYTLENYELERSVNYDSYWRQAVDTWRRGNIYIIE
jgi:GWxTD domain-containing protein